MTAPTIEGQDDPVELNFVIRKGSDWRVEFDWENPDGSDIDPTDMLMTVAWEASTLGGSFPAPLSSDPEGGVTLQPGSIVFTIPASATATLDFVTTAHQIHLTDNGGKKRIWGYGRTRLKRGP